MDRSKWEYKKLGDIALISAGQGAPQGENNYSPEGTPFVKAGNIESLINGLSEYDIQKVNDAVVKSHRLKLYKAGSVLFAKSGMSCMKGLVYTLKNDCYVVSHLAIVTPKDINSHYLNYYFQVHKPNSLIKDSAYPSISLKDIENLIILCPSQTDQQRIVAELDCLNEMIAVKQEQLKEFDKLAQSIFYDMFGDPVLNEKRWEIRPLGELISIMGGFAFKSSSYVDIGIRLVQIANVWEDNIKWDEISHVPKEDVNKRPDYLLKPGDIVMALTRPIIKSLGSVKIARIRNCDIPCALNQRVCKFAFSNSLLSPHWFYHFARTDYFKDMINSFSSKGMQPNVSTKEIESILTPYIPLSLQQQFADKISAIEAQKELVKQSIAETQALLDYTMDKYFG